MWTTYEERRRRHKFVLLPRKGEGGGVVSENLKKRKAVQNHAFISSKGTGKREGCTHLHPKKSL